MFRRNHDIKLKELDLRLKALENKKDIELIENKKEVGKMLLNGLVKIEELLNKDVGKHYKKMFALIEDLSTRLKILESKENFKALSRRK